MEDTISEPGGEPRPEARAELKLLTRSIELFLETRITSNNNFGG